MKNPGIPPSFAALALMAILAGCAAPEPAPPPPAPVEPAPAPPPPPPVVTPPPAPAPAPVKTPAELSLAAALALYDAGDYKGTIERLRGSRELWSPDTPIAIRIDAHKFTAFSYCVTGRRGSCRAEFDALLRLDPTFELKPAEAGHPSWGPVFVQAKKAAANAKPRRSSKSVPATR
jgi:hypothetical protein